jgi:hypothetical protein
VPEKKFQQTTMAFAILHEKKIAVIREHWFRHCGEDAFPFWFNIDF